MRVELGDDVDDSGAIGRLDEVELAASQTTTRRVDVDAENGTYPGLVLQQ